MTGPARYYDESLPPSVLNPAPPQATGATAGTPGSWTPAGCDVPANLAQVITWGVTASPATAWTSGQYVAPETGQVYWTGSAWASGAAP